MDTVKDMSDENGQEIGVNVYDDNSYGGTGILIPTRNTALFSWCLDNGLRLVQQLILMTIGLYNEPRGSYMPSILY